MDEKPKLIDLISTTHQALLGFKCRECDVSNSGVSSSYLCFPPSCVGIRMVSCSPHGALWWGQQSETGAGPGRPFHSGSHWWGDWATCFLLTSVSSSVKETGCIGSFPAILFRKLFIVFLVSTWSSLKIPRISKCESVKLLFKECYCMLSTCQGLCLLKWNELNREVNNDLHLINSGWTYKQIVESVQRNGGTEKSLGDSSDEEKTKQKGWLYAN